MNHVFLSYRHESDEHVKAVRNLGEKLKVAGLPVELDQFYIEDYPGGPNEGWRKWCEDRAEKSACVLIMCSKGWFDSYRKEGTPGQGLGAALEAAVFSGEIYDEKGRNARVRLVILDNFSEAGIPQRLKDWHIFRPFSGVAEFDHMTKWIRQRLAMPGSSGSPPRVVKTRVGRQRSLAAFAPARFRRCSLASIASTRRSTVRKGMSLSTLTESNGEFTYPPRASLI